MGRVLPFLLSNNNSVLLTLLHVKTRRLDCYTDSVPETLVSPRGRSGDTQGRVDGGTRHLFVWTESSESRVYEAGVLVVSFDSLSSTTDLGYDGESPREPRLRTDGKE